MTIKEYWFDELRSQFPVFFLVAIKLNALKGLSKLKNKSTRTSYTTTSSYAKEPRAAQMMVLCCIVNFEQV